VHALVPYPSRTVLCWTPEDYVRATRQSDSGSFDLAGDFADALMRDDWIGGVLEQRTLGMLALPGELQSASPVPDAIPDWPAIMPEAEQAALLAWGIVLGFGWARKTYSLTPEGLQLRTRTWHPRWFQWRDSEQRWYVQTRAHGLLPVTPGDGWVMYAPSGAHEPWKRGLWHRLAVPYLAKTYAVDDRSREGEVTAILVGKTKGLSEQQRQQFLTDLRELARDSRIVLPEGCDVDVVSRSDSARASIHAETIEWAKQAIAVTISGQVVTTEGTPGFSSGNVQKMVLTAILRHQEETFSTTLGSQLITPWLRAATGWDGSDVYHRWNIRDPDELTALAFAAGQLGTAVEALNRELAVDSVRVDLRTLIESAGLATLPVAETTPAPAQLPAPQPAESALHALSATVARPPAYTRSAVEIGEGPPERFQLFAFGPNPSDKGTVYLDRSSAEELLARLGSRDVMLDLEHLSLDRDSRNYDPDARAWMRLALESDGLWAVDVRWTADGGRRVREKLQRYISPAFRTDDKARVNELVNVALTALPATRYIEPLIAASTAARTRTGVAHMDPEIIKKALEAIEAGDADAALALLKELVAGAAGAGAGDATETEPDAPDEAMAQDAPPATEEEASLRALAEEEEARKRAANCDDEESTRSAVALVARVRREHTALAREVTALRTQLDTAERERLIVANRAKLPGKLVTWARTQSTAALRAYLANATAVESERIEPPAQPEVRLSAIDEELCKRFGTDPKRIQQRRAEEQRRAGEGR
jgi:phage I-like protein